MLWRVRGRERMRRLVRAPRERVGAVTVQWLADEAGTPPRVAFTARRNVGTAVDRNRLRRRLRAACRDLEHQFDSETSYMVSVHGAAATLDYRALHDALGTALARVEARRAAAAQEVRS